MKTCYEYLPLELSYLVLLLGCGLAAILTIRPAKGNPVAHLHTILNPPGHTIEALLAARASANARLSRFLGLTNTFTDPSPTLHTAFRRTARVLLARFTARLPSFPSTSRTLLADLVECLPLELPFADFVQLATFILVSTTLLGAHVPPADWRAVLAVTHGINDLWTLSKRGCGPDAAARAQLAAVHAHLRRWLPEEHHAAPLDLVIPTYETTWRVVAVLIARGGGDGDTYAAPLRALFTAPTDRALCDAAAGVVREVLRLHPPVKRIARVGLTCRWLHSRTLPVFLRRLFSVTHIADVRAAHTSAVWGASAADFDPGRFDHGRLTPAQRHAFASFGAGPLACVAANDAPRIAGLIAGAVLERITEGDVMVRRGEKIGDRRGWDGWSVKKGTCVRF
ncbi:hypothetical protein K488DRAFT_73325 [Vararia minispora EC-137]|uniref:Uncharacterized protein n=1 Tax=Vararia minispora EC-137 TaxID=1314806 RepID=A0ACB8QAZ4_9AGAM|nr:hypothetical protein K488DRAFT_73325 [Vararia minispora EC-137]